MKTRIVDVAINVFGKPAQTALTLFSLLAHSGRWIDRIYFVEERDSINTVYAHGQYISGLRHSAYRIHGRTCGRRPAGRWGRHWRRPRNGYSATPA